MAKTAKPKPSAEPTVHQPDAEDEDPRGKDYIKKLAAAFGFGVVEPQTLDERLDAAYAEASTNLRAIAVTYNISHDHFVALAERLAADIRSDHISPFAPDAAPAARERNRPLPSRAPVLWRDRAQHPKQIQKLNPAQFVLWVYFDWIGHGMTRILLRKLDPDLYRALSVFEHRHPEYRLSELPTLAEVIDQKIAALASEFTPDELRKLGSTLQTRHRRAKK